MIRWRDVSRARRAICLLRGMNTSELSGATFMRLALWMSPSMVAGHDVGAGPLTSGQLDPFIVPEVAIPGAGWTLVNRTMTLYM